MVEVISTQQSRKPFFTFAAWFSLVAPLLTAGWVFYAAPMPAAPPDRVWSRDEMHQHTKAVFGVLSLVSAVGFVAGCMSLWGVKANGAIVILPPAILGILISAALEVVALFGLVLTGLPGP
jgi:hypothetical protein